MRVNPAISRLGSVYGLFIPEGLPSARRFAGTEDEACALSERFLACRRPDLCTGTRVYASESPLRHTAVLANSPGSEACAVHVCVVSAQMPHGVPRDTFKNMQFRCHGISGSLFMCRQDPSGRNLGWGGVALHTPYSFGCCSCPGSQGGSG